MIRTEDTGNPFLNDVDMQSAIADAVLICAARYVHFIGGGEDFSGSSE